ncbi:MAG: NAD(P)-binding domain-containing protein [Streptosporangiaceae bacterium]
MPISESRPAVVIGAGPYGLAVAAHLRASGVPVRVFGEVMTTWRDHMPTGMFLKSAPFASSISAPVPGYTLAAFCARSGMPALGAEEPVPIDLFVRYGQWFAEQLVPGIEPRQVHRLERGPRGFELTLDDGEELTTDTVVMANGVVDFAYVPGELADGMPTGPVNALSHSSEHHDLSTFAGQDVAVIGAGQSALESAALLHEAGANVQVLTRGEARFGSAPKPADRGLGRLLPRPHSPLGPTWRIYPFSHAAGMFRYLPARTRLKLVKRVLGPLGAWWLRDRVEGRIPVQQGLRIRQVRHDGGKVLLTLQPAAGRPTELEVDHVIAGTGYKVDLDKLDFLRPDPRDRITILGGFPSLTPYFESSVPGLFFAGLTAAGTFGPVMRFVCGTPIAARRITAAVASRARRDAALGEQKEAGPRISVVPPTD